MAPETASRRVLLVGSLPYDDEASAMARALELAGDKLVALPDGEIGERSAQYPNGDRSQWVAGLAGRLASDSALFDVVKAGTMGDQGFPVDFKSTARLRPKHDSDELAERLELRYDTYALRSWQHFEQLRPSAGRPDLRMQVGLPTGLGIGAAVFSPRRAMRLAGAFAARLEREAAVIEGELGAENLIFQIEAPAEVVMAHRLPKPLLGTATKTALDLARRLPDGVPVGLHLCYGDLNNKAAIAPTKFGRLIDFANALIDRWPSTRQLSYVHLPFAAGTSPAPTKAASYGALRRLRLPSGTRLVAGFVHEQPDVDDLAQLLRTIEDAWGGTVDVATACGLGRRTAEVADELIARCSELAGQQ